MFHEQSVHIFKWIIGLKIFIKDLVRILEVPYITDRFQNNDPQITLCGESIIQNNDPQITLCVESIIRKLCSCVKNRQV